MNIGDVMLPNDPRIAKYEQLIHKYHDPDYEETSMDEIWNEYVRKFKIKRDKERLAKLTQKKKSNSILDAFKMLCGIKK
jgi:predicted PolB exonuclease-like 3'-5' exonuclease